PAAAARSDMGAPPAPSETAAAAGPAAAASPALKWLLPAVLLVAAGIFLLPRLLGRDARNDDAAMVPPPAPSMSAPPAAATSGAATRTPRPRGTAAAGSAATVTMPPGAAPASEAPAGCRAFDNQVWAQAVFDRDPAGNRALDPDGDGFACEELPYGAVPALWTDAIPASAEQARLSSTIDGDTIVVRRKNGASEHVRLVGIDTPETGKGTRPLECYGAEASDFTAGLLAGVDNGTVWLEMDREDRDHYGRLLRYVWYTRDGQVYMANAAIVRAGYAERYRDTPNRRYYQEFIDGQNFAKAHDYGLWSACR
ncbi:MAG: thermonuclease family protein, partial [Chloroflexota bacterium]